MRTERFERELAALGLPGHVEGLGSLAVLTLAAEQRIDERAREAAVRLAADYGFTHIALDLPGDADDRAAVHRD